MMYVEIERSRLIKKLAKIKEDQGHMAEALDLIQEIGVETFGTMAKIEKIAFSLEQPISQDFEKKTAMAEEFPDELILEILSWLPVTTLIRFRCVSKTWKFLISNPLVKLHLKRSSRNLEILLLLTRRSLNGQFFLPGIGFLPFYIIRLGSLPFLIQNPASSLDRILGCPKPYKCLIGSCNGLFSLHDYLSTNGYEEHWVCFWNPATGICSRPSPRLRLDFGLGIQTNMKFGFGYDDQSDSYKVVTIVHDWGARQMSVWVYCMSDVCWRRSSTFSLNFSTGNCYGYYLNGTVNWIGFSSKKSETCKVQIFSYDLNNDTCRFLSPPEFVPNHAGNPAMGVWNDCLFVSFNMAPVLVVLGFRDVRDETSWSRLMNISYETLNLCPYDLFELRTLCMWGDLLLLSCSKLESSDEIIIFFNSKENKIERTEDYKHTLTDIFSYVPSLVLPI